MRLIDVLFVYFGACVKKNIYILVSFLMLSCTGDIKVLGSAKAEFGNGGTKNSGQPSTENDGKILRPETDAIPAEGACRYINPGRTPLKRLTKLEYNNSVQDLFPGMTIPIQSLAADERVGIFEANTNTAVDLVIAEKYMRASESIAKIAVNNLSELCVGTCDVNWALNLGERAFRRPLLQSESEGLTDLFTITESKFDNATAVRMTVEAILQSSSFLYLAEIGEEPEKEVTKLTPFELASRLSYLLTGTTPDAELMTAAKDGRLGDPAVIEAEARRLLESPMGRDRLITAISMWFGIDGLENLDGAGLTREQLTDLLLESKTFIDHVVSKEDASWKELITADYGFIGRANADFYGVTPEEDFGAVKFPAERRGLLGHPSFLAAHGRGQSIIHRGKFINKAFLCVTDFPMPQGIVPLDSFPGESERSKADKRIETTEGSCNLCHGPIDGVGKIFDPFDLDGRFRTKDEFGNDLSSEGDVSEIDIKGSFDGIADLADAMTKSQDVRSCVTKQFFTYSLGRKTTISDACTLEGMKTALELSDGNLKEMLISFVKTDAFKYRRRLDIEVE